MQILTWLPLHHLPQAYRQVHAFVPQSALELVRVLFSGVVEVQAQVGVEADPEVVVHHEYLRIVLAGRACSCNSWLSSSTRSTTLATKRCGIKFEALRSL